MKYYIRRDEYAHQPSDFTASTEFDPPCHGLARALSVEWTEGGDFVVYWLVPDRIDYWG